MNTHNLNTKHHSKDFIKKINHNMDLLSAYKHCLDIAASHYENFPVISCFLPKRFRYPIAAIYAFARNADDLSDEGELSPKERINKLNDCWEKLNNIKVNKKPTDQIYLALAHTIKSYQLPIQLFFDLLTAFKQDVTKNNYLNFSEILNYCKYSANPVGRLLLYLTNNATQENLLLSDNICTSLQLINFLQDVYLDALQRNRCYLPLDEMNAVEFSFQNIINKTENSSFKQFILSQIQRADNMMQKGKPLGSKLKGLFGFNIRAIIAGGETIIQGLYNRKSIYDRPTINKIYLPVIFIKALFKVSFKACFDNQLK